MATDSAQHGLRLLWVSSSVASKPVRLNTRHLGVQCVIANCHAQKCSSKTPVQKKYSLSTTKWCIQGYIQSSKGYTDSRPENLWQVSSPEKHRVIMTTKSWISRVDLLILRCGFKSQFYHDDCSLDFSGRGLLVAWAQRGQCVKGTPSSRSSCLGNGGLWSSESYWRCDLRRWERTMFIFCSFTL